MKVRKKIQIRKFQITSKLIKGVLEYLLVIAVILENYSMLLRDLAFGVRESYLLLIFCMLCFSLFIFNYISGRREIYRKDLQKLLLLLIFSIGIIVTPGSETLVGVIGWLLPVFAAAMYLMTEPNSSELWRKYANVITVMAAVSLILYGGGSVLHIIPPSRIASFVYAGGIRHCNVYLGLQYESQRIQGLGFASFLFNTVYRNCAFFPEGPFYNILLCLGLAAEFSFTDKPRKLNVAIIVLTIISTYCTTGLLFLLVMMVLIVFVAGKGKYIQSIKAISIPACILIALYVAMEVINQKLQSSSGDYSTSVRIEQMLAGLRMLSAHSLFGHGFNNTEAFYRYTIYEQGSSVGLPIWLGQNGILIFMTYLAPFLQRIRYSIKRNKRQLFFWVGSFILFFMTACTSRTIFMLLLCSQLMWHNENNIYERI